MNEIIEYVLKIKIPKTQTILHTYCNEEHIPQYTVTYDKQRTKYTLYKVLSDYTVEKLKTSSKPTFKEIGYNDK
jgi:hypothetical protein